MATKRDQPESVDLVALPQALWACTLSFLSAEDAIAVTTSCQELHQSILPYEFCCFEDITKKRFVEEFPLGTDEESFLRITENQLSALMRNKTCNNLILRNLLAIFCRRNQQSRVYMILDDERFELKGILEFLRRTNCVWNDGPEILWLVEHPRLRQVVKACHFCHRKWNTQWSTCSTCSHYECPMCTYSLRCRGCGHNSCRDCQKTNNGRKIIECSCSCNDFRCSDCARTDNCRRCRVRLCPICTDGQTCRECSYDY